MNRYNRMQAANVTLRDRWLRAHLFEDRQLNSDSSFETKVMTVVYGVYFALIESP